MIQIIRLKGKDKHLYRLVAPMVMDPEVIRANNNYPFKTGEEYVWFIAIEDKEVVGFVPVEQKSRKKAVINNYYVKAEDAGLFKALFGSSFFQQEMKRNQQYRDNYACCDDIDVNIDFAEEIEDEIQNEKLFLSDYIPESYLYDDENGEMDDEIDLIE